MSDQMIPIPFRELLESALREYKEKETVFGVKVNQNGSDLPIGPAAGPHTQLAQNLAAAFVAGANCMELKTVQILEGEALGIPKPCIYAGHDVYNVEWSTELTVEQALAEYVKAYLLIWALWKLLKISRTTMPKFVMSVGYTLEGIKSSKIDAFIEGMKDASSLKEWKQDLELLAKQPDIPLKEIALLEKNSCIADTITLSTMHGCPAEDIQKIAVYLMKEKHLHTYIKLNPTLIGEQKVQRILAAKGYQDLAYEEENFTHDCTLAMAAELVRSCQKAAAEEKRIFGVKMTNTFPVKIKHQELEGSQMYLSGPALYALALNAASELAQMTEDLPISYSGGIDDKNVKTVLETGIQPVTVSSYLLKPGGYHNLSRLFRVADGCRIPRSVERESLQQEAENAIWNTNYNQKPDVTFPIIDGYDTTCAKCHNCVDVCPNRANIRISVNGQDVVIHRNRLCNACGCCSCWCIMGHDPYLEKITLYEKEEEYRNENSDREAILYENGSFRYRKDGQEQPLADEMKKMIKRIR